MADITLDAVEPAELMKQPTPKGVFLRVETMKGPSGWPEVTIMGCDDAVKHFVTLNWGNDIWEDVAG